jgi:hypothetical protein
MGLTITEPQVVMTSYDVTNTLILWKSGNALKNLRMRKRQKCDGDPAQ